MVIPQTIYKHSKGMTGGGVSIFVETNIKSIICCEKSESYNNLIEIKLINTKKYIIGISKKYIK